MNLIFRERVNFKHGATPAREVLRRSPKVLEEALGQKRVDGKLVPYAAVETDGQGQCFVTVDERQANKAKQALEKVFN